MLCLLTFLTPGLSVLGLLDFPLTALVPSQRHTQPSIPHNVNIFQLMFATHDKIYTSDHLKQCGLAGMASQLLLDMRKQK